MSAPCDGFRLAYARAGDGDRSVVLLHGWPGDHTDYSELLPLLGGVVVVAPDLRGFGSSDKHLLDPAEAYSAAAQARSIAALILELGLDRPVVAGYDIGSRTAVALARERPELVGALVLSPPLPGMGERVLDPQAQRQFWYQSFHQLALADELLDGNVDAVRAYVRHFWNSWSGPGFTLPDARLEHLVAAYGTRGAFSSSIAWYRAGSGSVAQARAERAPVPAERIATPTTVLWPEHDPLFPRAWSDRLDEFFSQVALHPVNGVGHFTPVECPELFARLLRRALDR